MKKILTIIAIVLPLIYLMSCKDNTVQPKNDGPILEFVSKTDTVKAMSGLMISNAEIKNVSTKQVTMTLKMEIISLTAGHSPLVCFGGTCLPPSYVDKLFTKEIILAPEQVSTSLNFTAELDPGQISGTSVIRYKFIPDGDTTKAISYTTTYIAGTGLSL
jgi:hypothetical protein